MTYIEKAIKKAIEGGWKDNVPPFPFHRDVNFNVDMTVQKVYQEMMFSFIFMQPDFWKALGRAEGWKESHINDDYGQEGCSKLCVREWLERQHLLLDHLAAKKPIEEFFKELLK